MNHTCHTACRPGYHDPECPNSRGGAKSRSGKSGRSKWERDNVQRPLLDRLRVLLQLSPKTSPNDTLSAAIAHIEATISSAAKQESHV